MPSTARTISVAVPVAAGVHWTAHKSHVWSPIVGFVRAGCHELPPSRLTSTAFTPRAPAKATVLHVRAELVHRGEPVSRCEVQDALSIERDQGVRDHEEGIRALVRQGGECLVEVLRVPHAERPYRCTEVRAAC